MDESVRLLLIEIAGYLTNIRLYSTHPAMHEEAMKLLEKIGQALKDE